MHAAVSRYLPVAVLLGWDVPELMGLVKPTPDVAPDNKSQALAAVTRAQKRTQDAATNNADPPTRKSETPPTGSQARETPPATPQPLTDDNTMTTPHGEAADESSDMTSPEFEFDDLLFSPSRSPLTHAQKRDARQRYQTQADIGAPPENLHPLHVSAEQFQSLQEEDPTLAVARTVAMGKHSTVAGKGFFLRDGLLYRRCHKPSGGTEQLVLPRTCRQPVLELSHNIPLARHLGRRKTCERILQRFYWPGLHRDVAKAVSRTRKHLPAESKELPSYLFLSSTCLFRELRWTLSDHFFAAVRENDSFWLYATTLPDTRRPFPCAQSMPIKSPRHSSVSSPASESRKKF